MPGFDHAFQSHRLPDAYRIRKGFDALCIKRVRPQCGHDVIVIDMDEP